MTIAIPNKAQTVGIAGYEGDDFTVPGLMLTGDTPRVMTDDVQVGESVSIPALTPINIVPATTGDTPTPATIKVAKAGTPADAITIVDVNTAAGASGTTRVYFAGCFNPAMLNWDASYTTDEAKRTAFVGAKAPTQIVVRGIATLTPAQPN